MKKISLITAADRITAAGGRIAALCAIVMMVIVTVVVVLRYGAGYGNIALQESVTYLHSCLFMLGVSYALKTDAHVRVDIFYRRFSSRTKAWLNAVCGVIFLLPFSAFIFYVSTDFIIGSWRIYESSSEPGGIPAVFLLKTLIAVMSVGLFLQGVAEVLRNTCILVSEEEAVE